MCAHEKQLTGQNSPSQGGVLSLVATPIGNLADMTHRAVEVLKAADRIYCEDTRVSGVLLNHYGIKARLENYHEHNAAQARPIILERLASGESIALISDAGTPLISDPGYKLVQEACDAGIRVEPIPGACAMVAALCASGLPTDSFTFLGFLAPKGKARSDALAAAARAEGTLVFYDTAQKVEKNMRALAEQCGNRNAVILREITKRFEERLADNLEALADQVAAKPLKGELVLMLAPAANQAAEQDYDGLLKAALGHVSVKYAAAIVASQTGLKKSEIYQRALELKGDG